MVRVNLFFEIHKDAQIEKYVQNIFAFLAQTDQVPLILGFKGILEKSNVVFNFNKNVAYVEEA